MKRITLTGLILGAVASMVFAEDPVEVTTAASGYAYFTGISSGYYDGTHLASKQLEYALSSSHPVGTFPAARGGDTGIARYSAFTSVSGGFRYEFTGLELVMGFVYTKIHSGPVTILPLEAMMDLTLRYPDEFIPHVVPFFPDADRDALELTLRRISLGDESMSAYLARLVGRDDLMFNNLVDALGRPARGPRAETQQALALLASALRRPKVQPVMILARFPFIVVYHTSGGADGTEVVAYVEDGPDDEHKSIYYMYAHGTGDVPIRYRLVDDPETWTTSFLTKCNTFRRLDMVADGDQWYVESISPPHPIGDLVDGAEQAWIQAKLAADASGIATNVCVAP